MNIVYGENGAGKATLLSLVFHLLSPSDSKGHRNQIANTPFSQLTVELADGTTLVASKDAQLLIGPVLFVIESPAKEKVQWRYIPGSSEPKFRLQDLPSNIDTKKLPQDVRKEVEYATAQGEFFKEIGNLSVNTFMLTSDRMLLGDKVEESTKTDSVAERIRSRGRISDIVKDHRNASLKEALSSASSWLQNKFLERSYGNRLSIDPYQDVVRKIAKTTYRTKSGLNSSQEEKATATLRAATVDLDVKARKFQELGLGSSSLPLELLEVIEGTSGNKLNLINKILEPHIVGLKARFDNLTPV